MPTKQFDVAIVDPIDATLEHWPRLRVTIEAADPADENAVVIERERAVAAYNQEIGVLKTTLPHDVRPAPPGSSPPAESELWKEHRHHERGATYFRGRKQSS